MPAEVVFIVGPGATKLAAALSNGDGSDWTFVPHEVMPAALPTEAPAAIYLMQDDLISDPIVEMCKDIQLVNRRPGIVTPLDLPPAVDRSTLAHAIEKSWILLALEQFTELGGESFVAEMLELFQTQTDQFLTELKAALDAADVATARRIVHTMKSSFANYGGRRMQKLAQKMETEAANDNLAYLQQQFSHFAARTKQFRDLLNLVAASSPLHVH